MLWRLPAAALGSGTGHLRPVTCVSRHHRKAKPPSGMSCSALRRLVRLLWPLLTSAAPSRRLSTPVAHLSPGAGRQTSQGKTRDLRAINPSHLRPHPPGDIGLRVLWPPRPDADASYALPVRQAGTLLTASFRSQVAPGTFAVRLAVPITRSAEDFHLQVIGRLPPRPNGARAPRAMPGAPPKKRPGASPVFEYFRALDSRGRLKASKGG